MNQFWQNTVHMSQVSSSIIITITITLNAQSVPKDCIRCHKKSSSSCSEYGALLFTLSLVLVSEVHIHILSGAMDKCSSRWGTLTITITNAKQLDRDIRLWEVPRWDMWSVEVTWPWSSKAPVWEEPTFEGHWYSQIQQEAYIYSHNHNILVAGKPTYTIQKIKTKPRTEDLREWGDLIRSCVVKKKDEFGQVGT